jgi:Arc/MetJ-type ribon-helix-helix transcriptional regulator
VAEEGHEGGGKPINLRINRQLGEYLAELVKTGLYGSTPTAVVRQLVLQGIQKAISDHHIDVRRS